MILGIPKEIFLYGLSQAFGFTATGIAILSFQAKSRRTILFLQFLVSTFWCIHYCCLGAFAGVGVNLVSMARNFLFSRKEDWKWVESKYTMYGFMGAFLLSGILTFDGLLSLLPTASMLVSTVAFHETEEKKIRILTLIASPLFLLYNVGTRSLSGVLAEVFVIVSVCVALYRYREKEKDGR